MTQLPSTVYNGGDVSLRSLFPTLLPEPERYVYEHVHDATRTGIRFPEDPGYALTFPLAFDQPPSINFYVDGNTVWDPAVDDESPVIPVLRGTSIPFPGAVPALAVGLGNEAEDQANAYEGGGFAGDLYAVDGQGNVLGSASYFSEPLYASILVQLIHENRDERDRLHNELRRVLAPLGRRLPQRDPLIRKTAVSGEKTDVPMDEAPFVMYVSVFTVEVWFEMLQAIDVTGPVGVIASLPITITPDPTIVPTEG